MAVSADKSTDTRQRVLEAAGEVFAAHGYEKATIRDIVERAGANLNAVNYYFRDKRGLYLALFEHAHAVTAQSDREALAGVQGSPPEQRLQALLRNLLSGFVLRAQKPWQVRLLMRELAEPSWVLDTLIDRFIRPRFEALVSIIRELVPDGTSELKTRLCAESVVAQVVHLAHARAIVSQLIPELKYTPEGVEQMVEHITRFSLGAVKQLHEDQAP